MQRRNRMRRGKGGMGGGGEALTDIVGYPLTLTLSPFQVERGPED
jgi:hypothetical protein